MTTIPSSQVVFTESSGQESVQKEAKITFYIVLALLLFVLPMGVITSEGNKDWRTKETKVMPYNNDYNYNYETTNNLINENVEEMPGALYPAEYPSQMSATNLYSDSESVIIVEEYGRQMIEYYMQNRTYAGFTATVNPSKNCSLFPKISVSITGDKAAIIGQDCENPSKFYCTDSFRVASGMGSMSIQPEKQALVSNSQNCSSGL